MTESQKEASSLLEKATDVLLVLANNSSDDQICAALAMANFLEKKQKNAVLFFAQNFPQKLSFLAEPKTITKTLDGSRDFVLIFNTERNRILEIKTEEQASNYLIRVTAQKGSIDPRDFSFVPADFKYQALITFGICAPDALEKTYYENTDLFFEIPKINIDNKSANSQFGQANLIDLTASSISEITADFLLNYDQSNFDQTLAQALLTGIICATESFQKPTTTPEAMALASKLMKFKADQPTIIRHIFKTKSLPFLKLWGRAMARLNFDKEHHCTWSLLSSEDFVQSRATEEDVPYILEEIQNNFNQAHTHIIFYSNNTPSTFALMRCSQEKTLVKIAEQFGLENVKETTKLEFKNKNLLEAEEEFFKKIKA